MNEQVIIEEHLKAMVYELQEALGVEVISVQARRVTPTELSARVQLSNDDYPVELVVQL